MSILAKAALVCGLVIGGLACSVWAGSRVEYTYEPYGNCIAITTVAANNVTVLEKSTYEYDSYRRCTAYTEAADTPQSRTWNWIYDRYFHDWGNGFSAATHTSKQWRVQIEPPYDSAGNHHLTAHWFDFEDRITEEYTGMIAAANGDWSPDPNNFEGHSFTYDPNGNKQTYTDPRGRRTEYVSNSRNLPTRSTEYPLAGESPADPRVTETSYDTAGNKKRVTFPDLTHQDWSGYDAFGQPAIFTDERGNHTDLIYVWGPMKKLYKVTTHRIRDDGAWEPQQTTFSYDLMGRPTQVLFPDSSHEDSTYECADGVGYRCDQPHTWRTRKGQLKTISYDARGRVANETWTGDHAAPAISRAWDDANRVTNLCNIFSTVDFGYDGGGLTLWEGNSIAGSNDRSQITYHRYGNGKVSDVGYPDGIWVHRDYVGRGQLKTVYDSLNSQPFQPVIDYTYLPDGKVDHADYRNGVRSAYAYDGRGMTKTVDHFRIAGTQHLSTREYTRDERDRILSFKKGTSGYNQMEDGRGDRFRYDAEGQLVEAWYNAADPANSGAGNNRYDGFNYDELGNRAGSAFVASHGPMTFTRKDNGLNQYSGWSPYNFIKYDDDIGSPWGVAGAANGVQMQDGNTTAGFNSLNQPVLILGPGMSEWEYFGYDPLGRCVKRWIGGDGLAASNPATYLYYDGWNLIQEGPSSISASRNYIHGARVDEVVKQIRPTDWWERYFQYDARGHCTLQTDASGIINEQYEYDAFGYPHFFDGSGNPIGWYDVHGIFRGYSPWGNRFLFTGREYLSELTIYDYRNRMYQPELGRFMQPDPKEFGAGDYNLYRYCHNDPVNRNDPMGLDATGVTLQTETDFFGYTSFGEYLHDVGQVFVGEGKGALNVLSLNFYQPSYTNDNQRLGGVVGQAATIVAAAAVLRGEGGRAPGALTEQQAANLARFEAKLPANASEVKTFNLPGGGKAFQAESAGRVPGSSAVYEKQVDATGKTIQYTKTTYGPDGKIIHVKDKLTNQ